MTEQSINLNLAVVPQDFLLKMESDLNELKELMRNKSEEEINSQWVESVKVPHLLGISRKTWQNYRDKRLIPFSQIGAKIFVKRSDIQNFMITHTVGKGG